MALLLGISCNEPAAHVPAEPPAEPVPGGTAVVAVASDITGINPLLDGAEAFNETILDTLFLQLFEEQPDFASGPPTHEPELAADWQWSEDGRSLAIQLRSDVVWSDGVPLTADDVVWTWRLQTDKRLGWPYADSKRSIDAMEAVDTTHLRVTFAEDADGRLADLNQGHILPRHRWRELPVERWRESGGWFLDNLVVSGPFNLANWRPDQQIVLQGNPSYFRAGRPRLDRVVFRIVPEPNSRLNHLLAGAVDLVPQLAAADAQRVEESPGSRLESFWARQYNYIHWNLDQPLFATSPVRRALTLAIDRQRIVDTLWFGRAAVASSPIPSSVWAHRPDPGPWPYDPDQAAALLAQAGWRDQDGDGLVERNGQRFSFELLTNADNRTRTDAAVMIQDDLRRVGVDARVRQVEFTTMVAKLRGREFDAVVSAFNIDTSLDLTYAFHSDSIDGGLNFGGYTNPEVDRLIEAARASRDPSDKKELLWRIQGILHDEQPFTFLWEPQRIDGASQRLRGTRPNPLSRLYRIEEWWLAPATS